MKTLDWSVEISWVIKCNFSSYVQKPFCQGSVKLCPIYHLVVLGIDLFTLSYFAEVVKVCNKDTFKDTWAITGNLRGTLALEAPRRMKPMLPAVVPRVYLRGETRSIAPPTVCQWILNQELMDSTNYLTLLCNRTTSVPYVWCVYEIPFRQHVVIAFARAVYSVIWGNNADFNADYANCCLASVRQHTILLTFVLGRYVLTRAQSICRVLCTCPMYMYWRQ